MRGLHHPQSDDHLCRHRHRRARHHRRPDPAGSRTGQQAEIAMTVLSEIVSGVREDLQARRNAIPLSEIEDRARAAAPARELDLNADFGVIAEVKRKSPSRGDLSQNTDPGTLAGLYAAGGARAVSVLTEARRFSGSLDDLDAVRAAVDIPVLRKDFMVDAYQVHEAREHGADIGLLIFDALAPEQLREFYVIAGGLGMTAHVEAHSREELELAADSGAALIGVITPNRRCLSVDSDRLETLAGLVPA